MLTDTVDSHPPERVSLPPPTRDRRLFRRGSMAWQLVWMASTLVAAQLSASTQDPDSRALALIDEMDAALGGRPGLEALTGLAVVADCSGPDGPFETEVESYRSRWVRFRQSEANRSTEIWSTPDATWTLQPDGMPRPLDDGVRSFVRSHDFHRVVFELASRFSNHRVAETKTIRDRRCHVIQMLDDLGNPASVCLDADEHLPVMLELNPEGAAGAVRTYFQNWKWVRGIQYFHSFDLIEGEDRHFRYVYRTIVPNATSALRFIQPSSTGTTEDFRALVAVLDKERQAHLQGDAELLVAHLADELVELSRGEIHRRTRDDVATMFRNVFGSADYERWDDLEPPRLLIAADGTLAWTARRVDVVLSSSSPEGASRSTRFISAHSATYEKRSGEWKMTSVTSTISEPG